MARHTSPKRFLEQVQLLDPATQVVAFAIAGALRCGLDPAKAYNLAIKGWQMGATQAGITALRPLINESFLKERELEWTAHGFMRSFRFWSRAEKAAYLEFANQVTATIADKLSPNVCLGYGAALAIARSNDLIPHDDDLDLIVAMPLAEYGSITAAVKAVEDTLSTAGYVCEGSYVSHRHVALPGGYCIDVFVGVEEDGLFTSYPGPRRVLKMDDVFPTGTKQLFGQDCAVPRDLERYISVVYGENWREPDPGFSHNWDREAFGDLIPPA
ncbi:hypothetical protein N7E70_028995 (plasmid) [Aminobacter sp. NyZ550]|uniref:hypothetical protein n=1 Tax=Aminobacter sp. NyZ550 TaxID=2979870 RepID=UPI0021D59461|nr:hypothetical protein [Aminobacter sp. NyZ550]WAX98152.1 hypothetical protein N7E70_028995 [Aminobacter sp. NyZ550]